MEHCCRLPGQGHRTKLAYSHVYSRKSTYQSYVKYFINVRICHGQATLTGVNWIHLIQNNVIWQDYWREVQLFSMLLVYVCDVCISPMFWIVICLDYNNSFQTWTSVHNFSTFQLFFSTNTMLCKLHILLERCAKYWQCFMALEKAGIKYIICIDYCIVNIDYVSSDFKRILCNTSWF